MLWDEPLLDLRNRSCSRAFGCHTWSLSADGPVVSPICKRISLTGWVIDRLSFLSNLRLTSESNNDCNHSACWRRSRVVTCKLQSSCWIDLVLTFLPVRYMVKCSTVLEVKLNSRGIKKNKARTISNCDMSVSHNTAKEMSVTSLLVCRLKVLYARTGHLLNLYFYSHVSRLQTALCQWL